MPEPAGRSPDDILRGAGTLTPDASLEAVEAYLGNLFSAYIEADKGRQQLLRQGAIAAVRKVAWVSAATKLVDEHLSIAPSAELESTDVVEERTPEELLDEGWDILHVEDQLALFRQSIRRLGFAGPTEAAEAVFVALHSRSMERPQGLNVTGPSAAGKTHTVEMAQRHHPADAVHDLTASSEKALAYSDFKSEHSYVLISESSALHRDGVGATIIRGLAWGNGIRYETVVKTEEGLQAQVIEKPGPTGLLTTSTKPLDPEISTRLLEIHIGDSSTQTRAIIDRSAEEAAGRTPEAADLAPWHAASKWLELAGSRELVIPFAEELVKHIPDDDVRMRRDWQQILSVVQTIAFMHQRRRERDDQGRIVAERRDYAEAHRLLARVLAVTLDTVTDEMRETVAAVEKLTAMQAMGISVTQLGYALGMSKSGASRRAKTLLREGYLVNQEDRKGYPARLKVGDPLPADRTVLPEPAVLFHDDPPQIDATSQHSGRIA